MNLLFVLIVISHFGGYVNGTSVYFQEFTSHANCQNAANAINNAHYESDAAFAKIDANELAFTNGRVHRKTESPDQGRRFEDVLTAVRAAGIGIKDLATEEADLEDVFLALTYNDPNAVDPTAY